MRRVDLGGLGYETVLRLYRVSNKIFIFIFYFFHLRKARGTLYKIYRGVDALPSEGGKKYKKAPH
jgi:hypothetical protein